MKVIINRKQIFKNASDVGYNISTKPKIVSFRTYWDGESKSFLTVFKIEIYCIVDQRSVIEEDISKIEVYMANNSLSHYDQPQSSAYALADIDSTQAVNNITFDVVNINETVGLKRFDDHVFLTSLEPNQNFNKFPAKKSNIDLKKITLENQWIEVEVFPEVGGKVWGATDKSNGNEFIYKNEVAKFRNIAMRGPWTSGGIEFNFGVIGHHPGTGTPTDYIT